MTATPPRADLPTLAAEAIWNDGMGPVMGPEALADAVLAAVLPEHRRMVLAEAAEVIEAHLRPSPSWTRPMGGTEVVDWLRRLAAAAPETTLSAPVPAEDASAVPEDTPGGFHEDDEPTDHIAAAFDAGTHGRTAPPRGQNQRLDVFERVYHEAQEALDRLLGPNEEDGAGEGLVGEIHLLAEQRDEARADRDRLAAQVAKVLSVHRRFPYALEPGHFCGTCQKTWPCKTVDALSDTGTDQTEGQP